MTFLVCPVTVKFGAFRQFWPDRGDYGLLVSHNKVPVELRGLFARQLDRIHLPANPALHPHPAFVQRHRERFASG